jgi:hypothetical protein
MTQTQLNRLKMMDTIKGIAVLLGIVLLVSIFSITGKKETKAPKQTYTYSASVENMTQLQEIILMTAKDRDSIKWINKEFSDSRSATCITYSGTNSFGGRVTERTCLR